MEVVSMATEIYASAAGTIAQIWILSELFPRKQSVKKVYIVGWILLNFCIAHFVLLPNIWQSLLGMGVMLLMSCIMLEGRTEQKMLVIIACNVFMILVSMLRGRITFFLSGESINEISIQGSESLARVLGIVLTNTLYLVTAYILICTPFTGHPVKGVFLCVTVTNSNERQSNYTGKGNGLNHQQTSQT